MSWSGRSPRRCQFFLASLSAITTYSWLCQIFQTELGQCFLWACWASHGDSPALLVLVKRLLLQPWHLTLTCCPLEEILVCSGITWFHLSPATNPYISSLLLCPDPNQKEKTAQSSVFHLPALQQHTCNRKTYLEMILEKTPLCFPQTWNPVWLLQYKTQTKNRHLLKPNTFQALIGLLIYPSAYQTHFLCPS